VLFNTSNQKKKRKRNKSPIFKTMTGITLTYLEKIQEERKDNLRAYQQK